MEHLNKINKNKQPSLTPKTVQTKAIYLQDNRPSTILQKKANNTGLPDNLKSGIENLSGHAMDDVKVHYNSDKPAQLNAHAYTQGSEIHLASGQEKHLPHEAWHVVQQKQGRVKPTMQMKGKVNVNDDSGLEAEATAYGALALTKGQENASYNVQNNISSSVLSNVYQRQVIINGVQKDYDMAVDLFRYDHPDWITDDYIRNYLSEQEYEAHDGGQPVKCGLLQSIGLWYRLPFPSAIAGGPPANLFLIGENHGYTPINSLLQASNQQNAKVLVESSASFRNTQMGVGVGAAANLDTLNNFPNRHIIELGLSKALHAFASMRAPTQAKRATAQPNTVDPYAVAGGAPVAGHQMLNRNAQALVTYDGWKLESTGLPKYRDANGILYFMRQTQNGPRGVRRPKPPGGNNYNQNNTMETFLRRQDIINALPIDARDAYLRVVNSAPDERNGNAYQRRYARAYNALRQASINNIHTVYPAVNGNPDAIVRRSPVANLQGTASREDGEIGMLHRNTAMLAGLQRAIAEGGYVAASLGAQHVLDIAAWNNIHHGLAINIITYNDFIRNYSQEAE